MPTGTSAPRMIRTTVRGRDEDETTAGPPGEDFESRKELLPLSSLSFHSIRWSLATNIVLPRRPLTRLGRNRENASTRLLPRIRRARRERRVRVPRRNARQPENRWKDGTRKEKREARVAGEAREEGRLGYSKASERSRRWGLSCRTVGGWAPLAGFVRGALAAVSPRGPYFKTVPNQARQSL